MEGIMGKFADNVIEAERLWKNADHLVTVTYPVVKDPKLLARGLESLHQSVVIAISNILKFEYIHRRISLYKDTSRNLDTFFRKCAEKYGIDQTEGLLLREVIFLGKKHRESGMEFSRLGKVIILDDNMEHYELKFEAMKVFLKLGKKLIENSKNNFKIT